VLAVRPQALERVKGVLDPANLEEDDRAAYVRLVSALERGGPDGLGQDLAQLPPEEENLIRRAWATPPPGIDDQVVDDVVRRIRQESLSRRRRVIIRGLAEAERRQDRAQVAALEMQLRELSERI
jgi:hypothetical protein